MDGATPHRAYTLSQYPAGHSGRSSCLLLVGAASGRGWRAQALASLCGLVRSPAAPIPAPGLPPHVERSQP